MFHLSADLENALAMRRMLSIAWSCPQCHRSGVFSVGATAPAKNIGAAVILAHKAVQPLAVEHRCTLGEYKFRSFAGDMKVTADLYAELRP